MKRLFPLAAVVAFLIVTGCSSRDAAQDNALPDWALGGFVRPQGVNPVIKPNPDIHFFCPMRQEPVGWMESDTFNPGAVVADGRIAVIFRAEDNSATGIGKRTSRLGLAYSRDGVHMDIQPEPVLFPGDDGFEDIDWPGGCEDPRIAVTEDGLYVMMYTSWNRKVPRLSVATSRDLVHWTKHGPAFAQAWDGRFSETQSKSGSIVTTVKNGRQVITKVGGKYLMYWGEHMVNIAESQDLIHWTPQIDEEGRLKGVLFPRDGHFDSALTECGPPAILTERGILLLYNGKNRKDERGDARYPAGTYAAGQVLFDAAQPDKVLARLDEPFFFPTEDFEKSGQYADGTVFIEGLTFFKGRWYLYYGCADSFVGVAVCKPKRPVSDKAVKRAIATQLRQYPASRVQDIYKNFCQDNLGPGHLIPNPEAARAYLMEELQEYREDLRKGLYSIPRAFYVPLGDKSNFIRVDLSVILNSQTSTEALLDAFVRSANEGKIVTESEWRAKWAEVAAAIRRYFPDIPDAEKDLATIDSLMSEGELIMHHSTAFENAYHPHYRIVAKDIFERDLF